VNGTAAVPRAAVHEVTRPCWLLGATTSEGSDWYAEYAYRAFGPAISIELSAALIRPGVSSSTLCKRPRGCCQFVRAPRWRPQIASGKARVAGRGSPRSRLATPH